MANRRMLPHTVTIFKAKGEGEDYKQQYDVTVHEHVYCPELVKGYDGKKPEDCLTVYLFDKSSTNMHFFDLNGTGGEYIAFGNLGMCVKPPESARTVISVRRRKAGAMRMWHWEVHAK